MSRDQKRWEYLGSRTSGNGKGKTLGLTPSNLSKTTIARFFNVHEEGLYLKVVHNGKTENNWPLSNGKFLVPLGTTNAHVIAFNASEDNEDFVQGAFDFRLVLRVLLGNLRNMSTVPFLPE